MGFPWVKVWYGELEANPEYTRLPGSVQAFLLQLFKLVDRDSGRVQRRNGQPYTDSEIREALNWRRTDQVGSMIDSLIDAGLLLRDDDGAVLVDFWGRWQRARPSRSRQVSLQSHDNLTANSRQARASGSKDLRRKPRAQSKKKKREEQSTPLPVQPGTHQPAPPPPPQGDGDDASDSGCRGLHDLAGAIRATFSGANHGTNEDQDRNEKGSEQDESPAVQTSSTTTDGA